MKMFDEILRMLKPHVANVSHCTSLAGRLADLCQEKIDIAHTRAVDEGYSEGYDDGLADGEAQGWSDGYDVARDELEDMQDFI